MSDEVVVRAARRIAEHARSHGLSAVHVVLHGGEPLLAGHARLRQVATELHSALCGVCRLDLRIHTNGVLLDDRFCQLFAEQKIRVGISIDGDRAANDRHRLYADGRSSYDKVIRAIGLLRTNRFRDLYAGLLCTIDVANDPVAVYEALTRLEPPRIDFLLPHATWDKPPSRSAAADTRYADWLIRVFERWLADGRQVPIRTFESIISTLAGGESQTEALGLGPAALAVIETDGSYEQADSLKVTFDGAPATGLNVFQHPLDIVGQHPGFLARQQGLSGLCQTCQECPVVASCGGGLYTHRYRASTGFGNPSVYCADLLKLITHVGSHVPREPVGVQSAPTHAVNGGDFRELAAGFGGAAAITQLAEAQRSLRRALLSAVYQAGSTTPIVPPAVTSAMEAAWAHLTVCDRHQPAVLDSVLGHPYVRVWAVRCLEQLRPNLAADAGGEGARDRARLAADLGHLSAIAAATAIRAGAHAAFTVPVVGSAVHLPTLGRLVLGGQAAAPPSGEEPATAAVDVAGDCVTIRVGPDRWTLAVPDVLSGNASAAAQGGNGGPGEWQAVRTLLARGLRVVLEDTDPYRDCHQWRAASRLTDEEYSQWQRGFLAAWDEIEATHSLYAPAIAAGLTAVTPLAAGREGHDISAAARHAFGAVAAALPNDPVTLALLLIHEFQHVKLGAILDLYDLYDPADSRLFQAPWREDLRPLEGLLQGTYAHLAVTDFWRAQQGRTSGRAAEAARRRFEHWRGHTCDAIETLVGSGSLTPLGARFVEEMRHSVTA